METKEYKETPWIRWNEIPWEPVKNGIQRKVIRRDRIMMVMYRFPPQITWPVERHEAEQGGYIFSGYVTLILPDEDLRVTLGPGDGYLIDSMRAHCWETLNEEVIFLDVFSPPREELMREKFAPNA